jgi:hypothetical protein
MAMTQDKVGVRQGDRGALYRFVETGSANTELTATMPAIGGSFRLVLVTVAYSAAPTQAGVTTTLDSGAGAGYDATLNTGSANAQYTAYQPSQEMVLGSDDSLVVVAPAGGATITASVAIYVEKL